MASLIAVRRQNYPVAIEQLRKAYEYVDALSEDDQVRRFITPHLIDTYLVAIVDADLPNSYEKDLNRIQPFIDRWRSGSAWYNEMSGWAELLVKADPRASLDLFSDAIRLYRGKKQLRDAGAAYYGQALAHAALGAVGPAAENFFHAALCNPAEYELGAKTKDQDAFLEEKWVSILINIQASFAENYRRTLENAKLLFERNRASKSLTCSAIELPL